MKIARSYKIFKDDVTQTGFLGYGGWKILHYWQSMLEAVYDHPNIIVMHNDGR
jgi:hypothetical protein